MRSALTSLGNALIYSLDCYGSSSSLFLRLKRIAKSFSGIITTLSLWLCVSVCILVSFSLSVSFSFSQARLSFSLIAFDMPGSRFLRWQMASRQNSGRENQARTSREIRRSVDSERNVWVISSPASTYLCVSVYVSLLISSSLSDLLFLRVFICQLT